MIHLLPGGDAPRANVTFLDRSQDASVGTYCWTRPNVQQCADASEEYLVVGSHLLVPPGITIRVEGEMAEVSGRLVLVTGRTGHNVSYDPVQELSFKDGTDVLTADAGEYTLDLFAHWAGGSAALAFGIGITRTG